jgi:hypothetical protein
MRVEDDLMKATAVFRREERWWRKEVRREERWREMVLRVEFRRGVELRDIPRLRREGR